MGDIWNTPFDLAHRMAQRRRVRRGPLDRDWMVSRAKAERGCEVGAGDPAAIENLARIYLARPMWRLIGAVLGILETGCKFR